MRSFVGFLLLLGVAGVLSTNARGATPDDMRLSDEIREAVYANYRNQIGRDLMPSTESEAETAGRFERAVNVLVKSLPSLGREGVLGLFRPSGLNVSKDWERVRDSFSNPQEWFLTAWVEDVSGGTPDIPRRPVVSVILGQIVSAERSDIRLGNDVFHIPQVRVKSLLVYGAPSYVSGGRAAADSTPAGTLVFDEERFAQLDNTLADVQSHLANVGMEAFETQARSHAANQVNQQLYEIAQLQLGRSLKGLDRSAMRKMAEQSFAFEAASRLALTNDAAFAYGLKFSGIGWRQQRGLIRILSLANEIAAGPSPYFGLAQLLYESSDHRQPGDPPNEACRNLFRNAVIEFATSLMADPTVKGLRRDGRVVSLSDALAVSWRLDAEALKTVGKRDFTSKRDFVRVQLMIEGLLANRQIDGDLALRTAQDVLKSNESEKARFTAASLCGWLKHFSEAERAFQQLADSASEKQFAVRSMEKLGYLNSDLGKNEDAMKWLRRAIAAGSRDSSVYLVLGNILFDTGRSQEAKDTYQEFLKLESQGARAEVVTKRLRQISASAGAEKTS